ncbi:MAG: HdeD family acid-resistance protein [Candidatus Limnocylindrales bacterium]
MLIATTVEMARSWWTFILRGVLAILFGVIAFVAPPATIAALVLLFGAWALVDGVFGIVNGIKNRGTDRSWALALLEGAAGIVAGVLALAFPAVAAGVLLLLISAWSIVTGVIEIVMAVRLREQITGELWLAIGGILSIVFGLLLFLFPLSGAITIVWIIGAFAIAFGISMIVLGWRLRGINARVTGA